MHFGIGWRLKTSLLCSSCARACCQHPARAGVRHSSCSLLLPSAPERKLLQLQERLCPQGLLVSEGCWADTAKEWSFTQKFWLHLQLSLLWRDDCNQRQFFIMDKRIMRYKRVCTRKFINYRGLASVMGRSAVCSLRLAEQAGSCTVFVTDQKQQPFDRCHVDLHLQIHPSEKHLCA